MILQISDNDHLIIRCHTFDHSPKMHDFSISINGNTLYICRNSGEEMKIHLSKESKPNLSVFDVKSKPLKKGAILIKLEKE